jgi:phage-related protein
MLQEWKNNILKGLDLWKADMQAKAGDFWGSFNTIWQSNNLTFWDKVIAGFIPVKEAFAQGNFVMGVFLVVAQLVAIALGVVEAILKGFGEGLKWVIDTVVSAGKWLWDTISSVISNVLSFFANIFKGVVDIIVNVAKFFWDVISGVIGTAVSIIGGILKTAVDIIVGVAKFFWDVISGVIGTAVSIIGGILKTAVDIIVGVAKFFWDAISGIISTILSVIGGVLKAAVDIIVGVAKFFWDAISGILSAAASFLGGILKAAGDLIVGAARFIWDAVVNVVSFFVGIFKNIIDAIVSVVRFFWNALADFISIITLGVVQLPRLQEGGIITKPTVLMAGEAGPEAIIPLPEFNALLNALNVPKGGGGEFTLVNEIHLEVDGRELAAIVKRQEVREAIIKGRW